MIVMTALQLQKSDTTSAWVYFVPDSAQVSSPLSGPVGIQWDTDAEESHDGGFVISSSSGGGFEFERQMFNALRPALEVAYSGKYVAMLEGRPVDSDVSLSALVRRFCKAYGERDAYFGFVGTLQSFGVA